MIVVKNQIYQHCTEVVEDRYLRIKKALKEIQQTSNNDTKSSAGDKYETGRAMAQLEKDKMSMQLLEVLKLKKVLHQINPKSEQVKGGLGSLIVTNQGNFYIAISVGAIKIKGFECFVVSPVSPIGKGFIGKEVKDSFSFNGKSYIITSMV